MLEKEKRLSGLGLRSSDARSRYHAERRKIFFFLFFSPAQTLSSAIAHTWFGDTHDVMTARSIAWGQIKLRRLVTHFHVGSSPSILLLSLKLHGVSLCVMGLKKGSPPVWI